MGNNYLSQQKELVRRLEDSFTDDVHKTTFVEMQKDYANDEQVCLTSVVFIPNDISSRIIKNVINPLKKIEPQHYFYPSESLHLTIKNIRTINKPRLFTDADIDKVDKLFNKIIPSCSVFEFKVEDIIIFPTSISVMVYCDETLQKLVLKLDQGLKETGVPDNKKYLSDTIFWGNITVCRFIENPKEKFITEVKKMRNLKFGKFKVEKVNLITCNAVCHPKSKKIIAEYQLRESNA